MNTVLIALLSATIAYLVGVKVGKVRTIRKSIQIIDTLILKVREAGTAKMPTFAEYLENKAHWDKKVGK